MSLQRFQVRKVKEIEGEQWEGREVLGGENKSLQKGKYFWTNHKHLPLRSRLTSSDNGIAGGNPNRFSFLYHYLL